jgi:hypothetical protein
MRTRHKRGAQEVALAHHEATAKLQFVLDELFRVLEEETHDCGRHIFVRVGSQFVSSRALFDALKSVEVWKELLDVSDDGGLLH